MPTKAIMVVIVTIGAVTLWFLGPPAFADGPFGGVDCASGGVPGCDLHAQRPGSPDAVPLGSGKSEASPAVAQTCTTSAFGPLCPAAGGFNAPVLTTPAEAGALAVSRLDLPAPPVVSSPSAAQLVGLPAWFWVPAGWWTLARSASATVPDLTVTATATPSQVEWDTGDGSRVVCRGPGTPWRTGTDPAKPSPDCGHTYTSGSSTRPDGVFWLVATVLWRVTWAGGGQTGVEPALGTSTTTTLRVGESQALLTTRR